MLIKLPVSEFDTNSENWPSQVSDWSFPIFTPWAVRQCAALLHDIGETLSFTASKGTLKWKFYLFKNSF
jgi:hypothetical protein